MRPWLLGAVLAGLACAAVVVATGKILDGPRAWLRSFRHWANPLPLMGGLLGCEMCLGFWAGFAPDSPGVLGAEGWWALACRVACGGATAILAYVVNLGLRMVEARVAEKEQENEWIKRNLRKAVVDDKAPPGEKPVVAPEGGPEGRRGEGDRRPG